jgi:hypothetical protein
MGSPTCDIHDEPDAARVVLEGWIVQSAALQSGGVGVLLRHVVFMADPPVLAKYNDRIGAMRLGYT